MLINQTYAYNNINILIGYFKLILIVDVVISIAVHIYIYILTLFT